MWYDIDQNINIEEIEYTPEQPQPTSLHRAAAFIFLLLCAAGIAALYHFVISKSTPLAKGVFLAVCAVWLTLAVLWILRYPKYIVALFLTAAALVALAIPCWTVTEKAETIPPVSETSFSAAVTVFTSQSDNAAQNNQEEAEYAKETEPERFTIIEALQILSECDEYTLAFNP